MFAIAPHAVETNVPARVQAAMLFIQFTDGVRFGCPGPFDGAAPRERAIDGERLAAYNAALTVMRLYFSGEMDFGSPAPSARPAPTRDDEPPKVPAPA